VLGLPTASVAVAAKLCGLFASVRFNVIEKSEELPLSMTSGHETELPSSVQETSAGDSVESNSSVDGASV
jgi:hypothetical protein